MITTLEETREAVVSFVAFNHNRLFTARELAGELVGLEKNVHAVLESLVEDGLMVKVGENYRRPVTGEERP